MPRIQAPNSLLESIKYVPQGISHLSVIICHQVCKQISPFSLISLDTITLMLIPSFLCSPNNFLDNNGPRPLIIISPHTGKCHIFLEKYSNKWLSLCGTLYKFHGQTESLIYFRIFDSATPYCMKLWTLLIAADLVEGSTIIFGLLVIRPPTILYIFYFILRPIINPPTTQHHMSIFLYLLLQIYLYAFLLKLMNCGTHCRPNFSEVIFTIPDPISGKVNNYKQSSDIFPSYPHSEVYHT